MNDIDRACAAFRALLAEQQARVAGMTAEQVDYTNKATVTIGLVDGDGIGPIIMEQAVRALEALLAGSMSLQGLPVSLLTAYAGCLAAAVAALALERRLDRKLVGGMLLYPVFMACFLPLQTLALFKTQTIWHEIRHSGVRLAAEVDLRRGKIA